MTALAPIVWLVLVAAMSIIHYRSLHRPTTTTTTDTTTQETTP